MGSFREANQRWGKAGPEAAGRLLGQKGKRRKKKREEKLEREDVKRGKSSVVAFRTGTQPTQDNPVERDIGRYLSPPVICQRFPLAKPDRKLSTGELINEIPKSDSPGYKTGCRRVKRRSKLANKIYPA